jgi:hypothetical protein
MATRSGPPVGSRGRSRERSPRAHRCLRRSMGVPSFRADGRGGLISWGPRGLLREEVAVFPGPWCSPLPSIIVLMVNVIDFAFCPVLGDVVVADVQRVGRNLSMTLSGHLLFVIEICFDPITCFRNACTGQRRDKDVREAVRDWGNADARLATKLDDERPVVRTRGFKRGQARGGRRSSRLVPGETGGRRPSSQTRRGLS